MIISRLTVGVVIKAISGDHEVIAIADHPHAGKEYGLRYLNGRSMWYYADEVETLIKEHNNRMPPKDGGRMGVTEYRQLVTWSRNLWDRGKHPSSPTCEACGLETATQGHHPNYRKPLEVIWLCPKCHKNEHRDRRKQFI